MIGFNESILFRCGYMGEFLINLHLLQVMPHKLCNELTAIVIFDGDALDRMILNNLPEQPLHQLLADTLPKILTHDFSAVHI